ncbi:acyl-CoA thioesterase/BAAT N-terminal domain-containing protein [Agromyces protaetiae]|nr:acyl-CoA thioesterase/BAAT N-terminal domain-containing protein [Agromyces protaetiae]
MPPTGTRTRARRAARSARRLRSVAVVTSALLVALTATGCSTGAPAAPSGPVAITAEPNGGPFDELDIRVTGLAPGSEVVLRATTTLDNLPYRSAAAFTVGDDGTIDLARDLPTDGAWTAPDPMAPFFTLGGRSDHFGVAAAYEPHDVELAVETASGDRLASTSVSRAVLGDEVEVSAVEALDFPTAFAVPTDFDPATPRPALLVLGGSEGGVVGATAVAIGFARLGYPALAVGLFKGAGQPELLAEVPLEPAVAGIEWLRTQPGIDPERVTAFGASRGGEVAVWLAATFPELVDGAIDAVGASEIHCSVPLGDRPAWTYGGTPLPCTNNAERPEFGSLIDLAAIDGPLVLACGTADRVWDSCALQARTVKRAEKAGIEVSSVTGEGASHTFTYPTDGPAVADAEAGADGIARRAFWAAVVEALGAV